MYIASSSLQYKCSLLSGKACLEGPINSACLLTLLDMKKLILGNACKCWKFGDGYYEL